MCLYPKLIINRKYSGTKKNGGKPPTLQDERVRFVPVACGQCMECRKAKANEWRVRLHEELKTQEHAYFITLTFAPEELEKLCKKYDLTECNAICGKAIRLFFERIRKTYKKSIKHWLITEMGQDETERIHLHGIFFPPFPINNNWLAQFWKYGICDTGKYCNSRTINYVVKYVFKLDPKHKGYVPQIFCSSGIGKNYITEHTKERHQYKSEKTRDYYTLPNGQHVALPIYYRNKLFTEDEREKLWIKKIEQDTRYINGIPIHRVLECEDRYQQYLNTLQEAQRVNDNLGYGNDSKEWKKHDYNVTLKMIAKLKKNS